MISISVYSCSNFDSESNISAHCYSSPRAHVAVLDSDIRPSFSTGAPILINMSSLFHSYIKRASLISISVFSCSHANTSRDLLVTKTMQSSLRLGKRYIRTLVFVTSISRNKTRRKCKHTCAVLDSDMRPPFSTGAPILICVRPRCLVFRHSNASFRVSPLKSSNGSVTA